LFCLNIVKTVKISAECETILIVMKIERSRIFPNQYFLSKGHQSNEMYLLFTAKSIYEKKEWHATAKWHLQCTSQQTKHSASCVTKQAKRSPHSTPFQLHFWYRVSQRSVSAQFFHPIKGWRQLMSLMVMLPQPGQQHKTTCGEELNAPLDHQDEKTSRRQDRNEFLSLSLFVVVCVCVCTHSHLGQSTKLTRGANPLPPSSLSRIWPQMRTVQTSVSKGVSLCTQPNSLSAQIFEARRGVCRPQTYKPWKWIW